MFLIIRKISRLVIRSILGVRAERSAHIFFHRVLRLCDKFHVPEEKVTKRLLAAICRDSASIIDVGANVGRYTWFFKKNSKSSAPIYSFEPNPSAFFMLEASHRENQSRVVCLNHALGSEDANLALEIPKDEYSNECTSRGWLSRESQSILAKGAVIVAVHTLDNLWKSQRIALQYPIFMKIDVEGFETSVLRGAQAMLNHFKPTIYFEHEARHCVRAGETPGSVFKLLQSQGYFIYALKKSCYETIDFPDDSISNYFAVHNEHVARFSAWQGNPPPFIEGLDSKVELF